MNSYMKLSNFVKLVSDCKRRDLTINAIAMDFDGNIIDPFGGVADLETRTIRFVGNAEERLREDYLRILRYFRFYGRLGEGSPDSVAIEAIKATKDGLKQISVERIWSEVAKIAVGKLGGTIFAMMRDTGVLPVIGMTEGNWSDFVKARDAGISDPAMLMARFYDRETVMELARRWKWSNEEKAAADYVAEPLRFDAGDERAWKRELVNDIDPTFVKAVLTISAQDAGAVDRWEVPIFPVKGADLIEADMTPGPEMGKALASMRARWIESDYTLTKNELMASEG